MELYATPTYALMMSAGTNLPLLSISTNYYNYYEFIKLSSKSSPVHSTWIIVTPKAFSADINLLHPTGHVMHQQFNIQQLYVLPTLYLCVLYLSENKQRLVPLTA
jgi:hypothetical protein